MKKVISLLAVVMMLFTVAIGAGATTGGDLNANEARLMKTLKETKIVGNVKLKFYDSDVNKADNFMRQGGVDLSAATVDTIISELNKAFQIYAANSNNGSILDMNDLPQTAKQAILDCAERAFAALEGFNAAPYLNSETGKYTLRIFGADGSLYTELGVAIEIAGYVKGNGGTGTGTGTGSTDDPIKQTGADYTGTMIFSGVFLAGLAAAVVAFSRKNKKAVAAA